jgi:uncharacterized membrane protein (DUF4010 family)
MAPSPLGLPPGTAGLLASLCIGLVIGLERGWRHREVADGGRVAGLRTFALTGLLGGVLSLGGSWLLAAGAFGVAALATVSYREAFRATGNLSVTSAMAMLLTYGLGALATQDAPALAVGAAVIAAVLLNLRPELHRWLRLMEHRELSAALQLLVLSAVILPFLPDASYGPYGALNPYRLWWAVVLIAGLSLSGHVAMRVAGPQRGALLTGLLGGLASSTAATLALARHVRAHPEARDPAVVGALGACSVMFLRMAVIVYALSPSLGRLWWVPMAAAAATLGVISLLIWRCATLDEQPSDVATDFRPFDLATALGFGAFLGLVSVLTEASRQWLGATGLYALALVSGLADVDAITLSLARMNASGTVSDDIAVRAIGAAVIASLGAKVALAWTAGGASFAVRIGWAHIAAAAVGTSALFLAVMVR